MEGTRGVLYGWAKSNVGSLGREGQTLRRGKITGVVEKSSCKDMMKILHFFLASVLFLWDSAKESGLTGMNPLCATAMEGQRRGWPDGTPPSRQHVSGMPLSQWLVGPEESFKQPLLHALGLMGHIFDGCSLCD